MSFFWVHPSYLHRTNKKSKTKSIKQTKSTTRIENCVRRIGDGKQSITRAHTDLIAYASVIDSLSLKSFQQCAFKRVVFVVVVEKFIHCACSTPSVKTSLKGQTVEPIKIIIF